MLLEIWIATVVLSYLIFRSGVKKMDNAEKESIPTEMFWCMLIPLLNLFISIVVWSVYCTNITSMSKADMINKIFLIKKK